MRWRPIKADKMCIPHTLYSDPKEPFCMPRLINKIVYSYIYIHIYYTWPTLIVPIFPDGAINATSRLTIIIILLVSHSRAHRFDT